MIKSRKTYELEADNGAGLHARPSTISKEPSFDIALTNTFDLTEDVPFWTFDLPAVEDAIKFFKALAADLKGSA